MEISKEAIEEVIKYIDHRFEEDDKHQSSNWSMPDGSMVSADVGYAYYWWKNCMKKELEEIIARKNTSKKIKKVVDAEKLANKMEHNSFKIITPLYGEELKTPGDLWSDLIRFIRESTVDIEVDVDN